MNEASNSDVTYHEKRAKLWDRLITAAIVALLLLPLPFVRFETWPEGGMVSQHLVMPWSRFRICYTGFPGGEPVEEVYHFTWKGQILPRFTAFPHVFYATSLRPPALKWQNGPEIPLKEVFHEGQFLKVETFWQPVILWPLKMGWRMTT